MQYITNRKLGTLINVICKISVICLVALNERVRECSRTFHVIRRDRQLPGNQGLKLTTSRRPGDVINCHRDNQYSLSGRREFCGHWLNFSVYVFNTFCEPERVCGLWKRKEGKWKKDWASINWLARSHLCCSVRRRDWLQKWWQPFYTTKTVQSRLGTPGDFTVLSQVSCVKPRG